MESKTFTESATQRLYRTTAGAAVSCSIQQQLEYDPDDGQEAGYYGWCGPLDDQSDYVLGPYDSSAEVFDAYEKRNNQHARMRSVTLFSRRFPRFVAHDDTATGGEFLPSRRGKKCMLCHKPIDADMPIFHCLACLDACEAD